MSKRAVRILFAAMFVGIPFTANGANHDQAQTKPATQHSASLPPQTQPQQASAQSTKTSYVSRDVCDKHPNLKQCS